MTKPVDQVFISYSRRDARLADRIARALDSAGFSVWIDRAGIRGGELWRKQIVSAITDCRWFVLLISPHSIKSDNVRKELDLAEEAKRSVLPVTIADTEIPETLRYQLAGVHTIDTQSDFETGVNELLHALGAEPPARPENSRGFLQTALAAAATVALCAAIFPLFRNIGLIEERAGIVSGLAAPLPSWLWNAGPVSLFLAVAVLLAVFVFPKLRQGQVGTGAHPTASALAVYLVLAVPGTLLLSQYISSAAALITAGGVWIWQARSGRKFVSHVAALSLALMPALPIFGEAIWLSYKTSGLQKASVHVPNPCIRADDSECEPPAAVTLVPDADLQNLSNQVRETIDNVFGGLRALVPEESDRTFPLLRLVNIVELHNGCETEDGRAYSFLMHPRLRLKDGTAVRAIPPVGFTACRSEFELESLKAARELLKRVQAQDRREFTDEEEMQVRREIVRWWYVALKDLAIRQRYEPAEWAQQIGIRDETIEKQRIKDVFPEIYESGAFTKVNFIWRGDKPEFSDEEVDEILDTFPVNGRAEVKLYARDAVKTHLGSLTGTDN